MIGDFEVIHITDQALTCVVHTPDNSHDVYTFPQPKMEPGLASIVHELEAVVNGAIKIRMRKALEDSIGDDQDPEQHVMAGFCKICNDPVGADEPGIRLHGPFIYCPKHSAL